MRNFLISLICIVTILSFWVSFSLYSSSKSAECIHYADMLINSSIPSGDWDSAASEFKSMSEAWDKYQKSAYFFIDAKEINEIDGVMDKSRFYLEAEDISNSNGEISYLREKIKNLHQSDTLILRNIM